MDHQSKRIGFALVGCGRIAAKHVHALTTLTSARLIAVCDPRLEYAKALAAPIGVPYYRDADEMMNRHPEVDVVSVLTPSGHHASHVLELVKFGKHILVEKPMALTLHDGEKMVRACGEAGIRLFVMKQNRTNPPVVALKAAMEAGRFGKLVLATVRVRWCRTQEYYDQDSWRGTRALDGGVVMNQASHHIDLLRWVMGEVQTVFAYPATRLVKIEAEDTVAGILRYRSGALGIVEATTATRPTDLEGSISVLGENGTVEIGGFAMNILKTWNFSDGTPEERAKLGKLDEDPPNVYGFGHSRYIAHVVAAIQDGHGGHHAHATGVVEGREALPSLALMSAICSSMETGREITVNEP